LVIDSLVSLREAFVTLCVENKSFNHKGTQRKH
jgi:hypothetical protein